MQNNPYFETASLGEKKLLKQKVAQDVAIYLGYFIFSKSHNGHPKVAQLAKNCQTWSPCLPTLFINIGLLTLAKFAKQSCWQQRHVTVITVLVLATLGDATRNRNNPICITLLKAAKASK
jgi:hypothetical protein